MNAQRESELPAWGAPGCQGLVLTLCTQNPSPRLQAGAARRRQGLRRCLFASWGRGMML